MWLMFWSRCIILVIKVLLLVHLEQDDLIKLYSGKSERLFYLTLESAIRDFCRTTLRCQVNHVICHRTKYKISQEPTIGDPELKKEHVFFWSAVNAQSTNSIGASSSKVANHRNRRLCKTVYFGQFTFKGENFIARRFISIYCQLISPCIVLLTYHSWKVLEISHSDHSHLARGLNSLSLRNNRP